MNSCGLQSIAACSTKGLTETFPSALGAPIFKHTPMSVAKTSSLAQPCHPQKERPQSIIRGFKEETPVQRRHICLANGIHSVQVMHLARLIRNLCEHSRQEGPSSRTSLFLHLPRTGCFAECETALGSEPIVSPVVISSAHMLHCNTVL